MGIRVKGLLILLIITVSHSYGQEKDFQLRSAVAVSADLLGDLDGSIELQQRFKENLGMYDRSMLTLNLGYGIMKGLKVSAGYRFTVLKDKELNFKNKYRLTGDLRYKKKVFDVSVKVRGRLQFGDDGSFYKEAESENKFVNRNLLGLSYHISQTRFTPYVNYEVFIDLNQPEYHSFNKTRLIGGCGVALTKHSELDLFFMYENEFNVSKPLDSYIAGISWEYNF